MLLKCCYPFCVIATWIVKLTAIKNTEFVAMAGSESFFIFSFSPLECEHRNQLEIVASEILFSADAKRK